MCEEWVPVEILNRTEFSGFWGIPWRPCRWPPIQFQLVATSARVLTTWIRPLVGGWSLSPSESKYSITLRRGPALGYEPSECTKSIIPEARYLIVACGHVTKYCKSSSAWDMVCLVGSAEVELSWPRDTSAIRPRPRQFHRKSPTIDWRNRTSLRPNCWVSSDWIKILYLSSITLKNASQNTTKIIMKITSK